MATYYVRTDGNNANSGTGPSAGSAWQTVIYALSNASGFASGDTLWIAPGVYRGPIQASTAITTIFTTETFINGDPTSSQFSDIAPGVVRLTRSNGANGDLSAPSGTNGYVISSQPFTTYSKIFFEYTYTGGSVIDVWATGIRALNLKFYDCLFYGGGNSGISMFALPTDTALNWTIERCQFINCSTCIACNNTNRSTVANYSLNMYVKSCLAITVLTFVQVSYSGTNSFFGQGPVEIRNCTVFGSRLLDVGTTGGVALSIPVNVQNSIFISNSSSAAAINAASASTTTEDYNFLQAYTLRSNVTAGANSKIGVANVDIGQELLYGFNTKVIGWMRSASDAIGMANSSVLPTGGDLYGNSWASPPSAGAIEFRSLSTSTGGLIVHPGMTGGIRG